MSVIVRRAGRRDLDAIHALWRALREAAAKADPRFALAGDADARVRDHREIILSDPRTRFFVAEEQGYVLGYLHAQVDANEPEYETTRFGTIVDLVVREDRRREGIARALLDSCKEWLRSLGVKEYRAAIPAHAPEAAFLFERDGAGPLSSTFTAPT